MQVNADLAHDRLLLAQRVMELTGKSHRDVMASIGVTFPPLRVQHLTEEEAAGPEEDK